MKQLLILFCILAMGKMALAQWTSGSGITYTTDKVGIGTAVPDANLDVVSSGTISTLNIGSNGNSGYQAQISFMDTDNASTGDGLGGKRIGIIELQRVSGNTGQDGANMIFYTHEANGSLKQPLVLLHSGSSIFSRNVGIGTSSPQTGLHLSGSGAFPSLVFDRSDVSKRYDAGIGLNNSLSSSFTIVDRTLGENRLDITSSGNVGIGTTTPSEKLAVNGKIRAKEIKVEATDWPDYVFENAYKLPDLQATDKFIKENKHLPEVPSAKEVEENGISLGEMNAKLLKKIEELTLHMIDFNKQMGDMRKENQALKAEVAGLKKGR